MSDELLREYIEKSVRKNAFGYAGVGLPESEIQRILAQPINNRSQSTLLDALTMMARELQLRINYMDRLDTFVTCGKCGEYIRVGYICGACGNDPTLDDKGGDS